MSAGSSSPISAVCPCEQKEDSYSSEKLEERNDHRASHHIWGDGLEMQNEDDADSSTILLVLCEGDMELFQQVNSFL